MPVERVYADPHVKADVGRVALQRGPIVYCLEGVDNGGQVRNLCLPQRRQADGDVREGPARRRRGGPRRGAGGVARRRRQAGRRRPVPFQAVPYSTWDNRKPGPMVVWLPETPELAELPGEDGVLSNGVRIRGLARLPDRHAGRAQRRRAAEVVERPRHPADDLVGPPGSDEWVSYRFPQAAEAVDAAPSTGSTTPAAAPAGCRPSGGCSGATARSGSRCSWRRTRPTAPALDRFNKVTFEPVTTRELKLEVKLRPGFSGGVLRWAVR